MKLKKTYYELLIIGGLITVFFILGLTSIIKKSPTFDETVHITGGYAALSERDYRINPENGILPQVWAAIPLCFNSQIKGIDTASPFWEKTFNWNTATRFLYKSGNDYDTMFLLSRIMMLAASTLTGIFVYLASKQLWGKKGAILSLILFVLSPTILANSRLITSDSFSTLFFLISAWSFHRLINKFSIWELLFFSFSTAFLFLSKMSAPIIIPIFIILIFLRLFRRKQYKGAFFNRNFALNKQWKQATLFSCYILFAGLISFISMWGVFGFRYSMLSGERGREYLEKRWDKIVEGKGIPVKGISVAREYKILPEAYIYGFGHVLHESKMRHAFLNGKYSPTGWWYFFPLTFIMKTPLPVLLLFFLGFLSLIFQKKRLRTIINLNQSSYLLLLISVYFIFSLSTNLNIGHRHLMVIYPPIFIIAGGTVFISRFSKFGKYVIYMLLFILLFENLLVYPHYLTYFSPVVGGSKKGYKHLVDSSLDWGQELKGLKSWIKENKLPDDKVYISYFGSTDLKAYGLPQKRLLCCFEQHYPEVFELKEGTYFISATMLQMVYEPELVNWTEEHEKMLLLYRNSFQRLYASLKDDKLYNEMVKEKPAMFWVKGSRNYELLRFSKLVYHLRNRKPDHMIGNSILVFELTDDDLHKIIGKELVK